MDCKPVNSGSCCFYPIYLVVGLLSVFIGCVFNKVYGVCEWLEDWLLIMVAARKNLINKTKEIKQNE